MNTPFRFSPANPRQTGYGLIEVLIAALLLAIGFVALAKMQSGLIGSAADARDRTVATQLASDQIEAMRAFSSDAQYHAIDSSAAPEVVEIGGTRFTRSWEVERMRYNPDPNEDGDLADAGFETLAATETAAELTGQPDLKQVRVAVGWTTALGEEKQVVLRDIISASNPRDGLNTAREDGESLSPQVRIYKPSEEGVIPIAMGTTAAGDDVAAAASNPKPQQFSEGTTGTTKFTVQNFISDQTNPLLQSRVDFAYASCVCKMAGTSTEAAPAFEPTYWDGLRYVAPKPVAGKTIGVRDTSVDQDPALCDTCCRDHHDTADSEVRYDPFRTEIASPTGNHLHFDAKNGFNAAISANGGVYSESCRLVRVDGIYRVATDTRLEDLALLRLNRSTTPPNLPKITSDAYAAYARSFVLGAFAGKGAGYPQSGLPSPRTTLAPTYELDATGTYGARFMDEDRNNAVGLDAEDQFSLAARGLYIDWLSPKALERLGCIGDTSTKCAAFKDMDVLQMVPFVAVNLTDLANWSTSNATHVSVRNDPIPLSGNGKGGGGKTDAFVRGEVTAVDNGQANVLANITRSNSGVVDTRAVDPGDLAQEAQDQEEFGVGEGADEGEPGNFIVRIGDSTGDRNFADLDVKVVMVSPEMAAPVCVRGDRNTNADSHTCLYERGANALIFDIGNYNYPTCAPLGNKWVYDQVNNTCVLPPSGKGKEPTYAAPTIRDFQLCSVSSPAGFVKFNRMTVNNAGTALESTRVEFTLNGAASLGDGLLGSTGTFVATFGVTCN